MKKTNINKVIEYLSTTLILSYFFVHNIFLVLIGITFSLYLININFINSIIRTINKHLDIKQESIELIKNDKVIKSNSINIKSPKEDAKLTLVETIEELGFIPSIDKNDESKAA
tara:strand:- start:435 stop:776 length:342 start_codon:yes stop_codon:yes gene_type:complete